MCKKDPTYLKTSMIFETRERDPANDKRIDKTSEC